MTIGSEVVLFGSDLQPGETVREVCPHCGGGSSAEKSLAITRTECGGLVYVCHRATCPAKGGTNPSGSTNQSTTIIEPKKVRKTFTGNTVPLSDSLRERIIEIWGVHNPEHWYWTPEYGGRLAMSIRSPKYAHRGWVLRDIRGRSAIKALTYLDEGEESLSWYKTKTGAPTVLVEDIPSAVRASQYINAVALLGTGVGLSKANEIATHASTPIIVALDQDATSQSFDRVRRYSLLWDNPQIIMLRKDIKDMDQDEVRELLGDYNDS